MLLPTIRIFRVASLAVCLGVALHTGQMRGQDAAAAGNKTPAAAEARGKIAYAAPSEEEMTKRAEAVMGNLGKRRITLMEAVRNTLLNDPTVKLADEEIHRRAADLQIENGEFDWRVRSQLSAERKVEDFDSVEVTRVKAGLAQAGLSPATRVRSDTRALSLELTHKFRNGIAFRPFVEFSGSGSDLARHSGGEDVNRSDLGLELTFPLGAGRGRVATAGREMAAKIELDGSYWLAHHTASKRVSDTVDAYWSLVAAQERLRLQVRSEVINGALEALTQEMIKSELVPRAEDAQVKARTLSVVASRLEAEIALQDVQAQLALTMGYDTKAIIYAPLAAEGFPEVVAPASFDRKVVERYVNEAVQRRGDRLGSLMSEGSGRMLVEQARLNVKPRVDLFVRGFGSGNSTGSSPRDIFGTWTGGLTGPGVAAGLAMDWPVFKDAERGLLKQRESLLRTQQLTTESLDLGIARDLSAAQFVLHTSGRLYDTQKKALAELEKALEFEREKFRLGEATAIDSVTTEERLTSAGLGVIDARLQNAVALGRLRFGTATMLGGKAPLERKLARRALTTVPEFSSPAPVLPLNAAAPGGFAGRNDPYRVLQQIDAKSGRR